MMKFVILSLSILVLVQYLQAEDQYPVVGKPCPDFRFENVDHFNKKSVSLNDLRGKWIVLDFWSIGCTACVKSFPGLSQIQERYADSLQVLSVGISTNGYSGRLKSIYEKWRAKDHLVFPIAYDSIICRKWKVWGAPFIVVVDPFGTVKAVTTELSEENISVLMSGRNAHLMNYFFAGEKIDRKIPFLIAGNGGEDTSFMFRSLIAKFDPNMTESIPIGRILDGQQNFLTTGIALDKLYMLAYKGAWYSWDPWDTTFQGYYPKLVLDISDSGKFKNDYASGRNIFSYSVDFPYMASKETIMKALQNDLNLYFGYQFDVEKRIMSCYKLVATPKAKIAMAAKSTVKVSTADKVGGFTVKNQSMDFLTMRLSMALPGVVIDDSTGINGYVDFTISAIMTDFGDVRKALQEQGLDLIKYEREFKIMVVRDTYYSLHNPINKE